MNLLGLFALFAGLILLQTSVLSQLVLGPVRPDLVLLALVAWALTTNTTSAVKAAILGALLLDLFSSAPVGISLVGLLAALLLLRLGEAAGIKGDLLAALVMAFLATLLYDAAYLLVLEAWGDSIDWPLTLGNVVLPTAVLNALVMPIVYGIVSWWQQRLALMAGPRSDREREA